MDALEAGFLFATAGMYADAIENQIEAAAERVVDAIATNSVPPTDPDHPPSADPTPIAEEAPAGLPESRQISFVTGWDDYVGQERAKWRLRVTAQAAASREDPMPHILITGPPGTGKSTLARLLRDEYLTARWQGAEPWHWDHNGFWELPAPFTAETLARTMHEQVDPWGLLFVDEIHRLAEKRSGAEPLLLLLEEGRLGFGWPTAEWEDVAHFFTMVAATTDASKLPETVLDRFGVRIELERYSLPDMVRITHGFTEYYGEYLRGDELLAIAKASLRTPRYARELVGAFCDLLTVSSQRPTTSLLFEVTGVDPDGLRQIHRDYLSAIKRAGARRTTKGMEYRLGAATIMALIRENRQAGLDRVERVLLDLGLVELTSTGRALTDAGVARANRIAL